MRQDYNMGMPFEVPNFVPLRFAVVQLAVSF